MPLDRVLQPPKQSFLLLGPRGSGKSTWLRSVFPDAYPEGPQLRTEDGIDVMPFDRFARLLAGGALWD